MDEPRDALVRRAVRGQDDVPILDQPGPNAVASAPISASSCVSSPTSCTASNVAVRRSPFLPSAPAEPALSALLAEIHRTRAANLRSVIDALQSNGSLRVPPTWALAGPELHHLPTRTRGWSRAR